MHKLLIITLISSLLSINITTDINAQNPPKNPPPAKKIDCNHPRNIKEENQCAISAYKDADKELNKVYEILMAIVKGEEKTTLINAEIAWIKFRDTNCLFTIYPFRKSKKATVQLNNCLEKITRERTTELRQFIQDRTQ